MDGNTKAICEKMQYAWLHTDPATEHWIFNGFHHTHIDKEVG